MRKKRRNNSYSVDTCVGWPSVVDSSVVVAAGERVAAVESWPAGGPTWNVVLPSAVAEIRGGVRDKRGC